MNFENLFNNVINEKKAKLKPLSGYDYYKSIRKETPKPGAAFKDKSKYNRKEKYKKDLHESVYEIEYYPQIAKILTSYGLKAYQAEPIMEIVQKAIVLAYKEGVKAGSKNPFK